MIRCSCDNDVVGIHSVGTPRFVTCRTPRISDCCRKELKKNEGMYIVSFFDFYFNKPVSPSYICEKCGDMALNLMDRGMCFSYSEDIVQQWRDYIIEQQYDI